MMIRPDTSRKEKVYLQDERLFDNAVWQAPVPDGVPRPMRFSEEEETAACTHPFSLQHPYYLRLRRLRTRGREKAHLNAEMLCSYVVSIAT